MKVSCRHGLEERKGTVLQVGKSKVMKDLEVELQGRLPRDQNTDQLRAGVWWGSNDNNYFSSNR